MAVANGLAGATATAAATMSAAPVVVGAATGLGLWAAVPAAINAIGFTASGIAGGSFGASMMSAAAVASGGGVASGSAVAVLQSIGVLGVSNPVGLGIVGTITAVGMGISYLTAPVAVAATSSAAMYAAAAAGAGAVVGAAIPAVTGMRKPHGDPEVDNESSNKKKKKCWVVVEVVEGSGESRSQTFDNEDDAREAYNNSSARDRFLIPVEN